ncbi:MAG: hypothetical protein M1817_001134 [Caeruleum heppii]|nr:MAG: hypothetical protein M1817_001134 [Caeruleum heppii]
MSTTPYKDIKNASTDAIVFRQDVKYTERETDDIETGLYEYLVVGYTPREMNPDHLKKFKALKQRAIAGVERSKEVISWDEITPLSLVVTQILSSKHNSVQLWALLKPRSSLRTSHQIARDRVFYRFEFRDNSTSIKDGEANWNERVLAQSVRPEKDKAPSAKQFQFRRAQDSARVLLIIFCV